MNIKADEEGVQALKNMASSINDGVDTILSTASGFKGQVEGFEAIGPHKEALLSCIEQIEEATKASTSPARTVAEKVEAKAQEYQNWIDANPFSGLGG